MQVHQKYLRLNTNERFSGTVSHPVFNFGQAAKDLSFVKKISLHSTSICNSGYNISARRVNNVMTWN